MELLLELLPEPELGYEGTGTGGAAGPGGQVPSLPCTPPTRCGGQLPSTEGPGTEEGAAPTPTPAAPRLEG